MPSPRVLAKKPLTEAILEVRWALEAGPTPDTKRDPHYKFLLGTLFGHIRKDYPYHEELPLTSFPEDMTPHMVHHRFRVKPGGWPLLQVGPGVFTVNETTDYQWEIFERRINDAIPALVAAHPAPEALKFEMLLLRYINAIPMDFRKTNVLEFLTTKMQTSFSLPDSIFADGTISRPPVQLSTEFVFPCKNPGGVLLFKFNTGRREKEPALLFELWFTSRGAHVPPMPQGFKDWAQAAHGVIETSFFHLVEGELEKEFSGDA